MSTGTLSFPAKRRLQRCPSAVGPISLNQARMNATMKTICPTLTLPIAMFRCFDCGISNKPAGYRICNRILPSILFKILLSGSLVYNGMTMQSGDAIFVEPYHPFNSVPNVEGASVLWCVWRVASCTMSPKSSSPIKLTWSIIWAADRGAAITLFSSVIYNHYLHVIDINAFVSGFTDQLLAFLPVIDNSPGTCARQPSGRTGCGHD